MKYFWIVPIIFLAGCVGSINMKSADRYYQAALEAEWASEYELSKEMYYRSFVNARSGSASDEYISATLYGYGRMLGYSCDLSGAEAAIKESLVLERSVSGPISGNISKRLSELARLSIAQGKYGEASGYFQEAVPMLEELGMLDSDPIGYADYLEIYSASLRQSEQIARAEELKMKAKFIRENNSGKQALFVPVNYGNGCEITE